VAPWRPGLDRCAACGTAVTTLSAPPLDDLPPPRGRRAAGPVLRAYDAQRLRLLGPPRGALLDVGAGRGRFVAAARRAGWDARGIEPAAGRAAAGGVEPVGVEDAAVAPGSLAAVTVWHVLEHVADPAGALRAAHRWLRPDGVLLVGVPNLGSLQARLAGERWYHLDLPRHRTHFTVAGLRALLARTGFAPRGEHHLLLEHNAFGLWQSLVPTREPSYLFRLLRREARWSARDALVTAAAVPLAPVAAVAEAAAGAARRGGTVAVVAGPVSRGRAAAAGTAAAS
jgi:SAM-dependent methyltransferase